MSKSIQVYNFVFADREAAAKNGTFSFRSYTDKEGAFGNPGSEVIYNDGSKDRHGRPVGKFFILGQSHYNLQARENQKDVEGRFLKDFFANAPFCEGSPNGDYRYSTTGHPVTDSKELFDRDNLVGKIRSGEIIQEGVKIKLMNQAKDAALALEVGTRRAKAQLSAGELDDETLQEVAACIGVFGEPDEYMRFQVYNWAGKAPADYFNVVGAGDRAVRAHVRKALADGVFTQKGPIIYWKDTVVGNDEDSAVSKLISDEAMMKALQEVVDLKIKIEKKKKK